MTTQHEPQQIAFLGTGRMGAPMAANLARAGFAVRAWDRTASHAAALIDQGVTVAASPAEAVRGAGILITMLADGPATEQAWDGPGGLAAAGPGLIWIQMATVGIDWTERLANTAARYGVHFFDAPVSGSQGPAQAGQLTILASGPPWMAEAVAPVFAALGRATAWLGPAGQGTRAKLVLNSWLADLTETTAETLRFAGRLGLDPGRDRRPAGVDAARLAVRGAEGPRHAGRRLHPGVRAQARAQGRGSRGAGRAGQRRRAHPHQRAAAALAARRRRRPRR